MYKAFWHGHEIFDIDYHFGWCEILFKMDSYKSPLTESGRYRVRPEDIEIREVNND